MTGQAEPTEKSSLIDLSDHSSVVLAGNPNAGKTTLFNQLTGLRHKTANFPGTTLDVRTGPIKLGGVDHELFDLPGLYNVEGATAEERVALDALLGTGEGQEKPGLIILILDATNLVRNLFLAGQVLELGLPTVVALNMTDLAEKAGSHTDADSLADHLGAPVVPLVARTGQGVDELRRVCEETLAKGDGPGVPKLLGQTENLDTQRRYEWAEAIGRSCTRQEKKAVNRAGERADQILTHPVLGVGAFLAILFGVFYLIFTVAAYPMEWIDGFVGSVSVWVGGLIPEGQFQSLMTDGVIAGVGGVLVFLPQICILFFCISLLEDSGYLARAACVMDRILRRVGLPAKAFVPMLSAHACAIPAIMSTRVIEDKNDRLVTILILPLMTCSARLPVYAMVTALVFPTSPAKGALAFTGAYALGIAAAMMMAFLFRRTLVKTPPSPLILELPSYKAPGIKTALITAYDRGIMFVRKAGTIILAISIVLWALMSYPRLDDAQAAAATNEEVAQQELAHSFAGRLGHFIEPVLEPIGFDWKIGVGVIASFAAREVVVSALSVIYGVGDDPGDDSVLLEKLKEAKRDDGTPVFSTATSFSFMVFFVLAMQCLPTQAVTRRETGQWRWAGLQLAYMSVLAYGASFVTYQALVALGVG